MPSRTRRSRSMAGAAAASGAAAARRLTERGSNAEQAVDASGGDTESSSSTPTLDTMGFWDRGRDAETTDTNKEDPWDGAASVVGDFAGPSESSDENSFVSWLYRVDAALMGSGGGVRWTTKDAKPGNQGAARTTDASGIESINIDDFLTYLSARGGPAKFDPKELIESMTDGTKIAVDIYDLIHEDPAILKKHPQLELVSEKLVDAVGSGPIVAGSEHAPDELREELDVVPEGEQGPDDVYVTGIGWMSDRKVTFSREEFVVPDQLPEGYEPQRWKTGKSVADVPGTHWVREWAGGIAHYACDGVEMKKNEVPTELWTTTFEDHGERGVLERTMELTGRKYGDRDGATEITLDPAWPDAPWRDRII